MIGDSIFVRSVVGEIIRSLTGQRPLIQVLTGARQVGKTTAVNQLATRLNWPTHFASADAPRLLEPEWVEAQWRAARALRPSDESKVVLLVLDEIQKVPGWSEVVKRLWDEECASRGPVRAVLLGSSALLLQHGLSESLAGRFYLHRCPHWTFDECQSAFGWSLEQWIYFGGYPGSAGLIADESSWKRYISDSLIETVLTRDVFQLQQVAKPALLRQLFILAAAYPAQILSYNKMLGQLSDAGNTTTLAHYLDLLGTTFLVSGLRQAAGGTVRKRGSSPKLVLWNNALINALSLKSFKDALGDESWWGRLVENAVGAHLLNTLQGPQWAVGYWRDGDAEVDFVVSHGERQWGLEVKSGRSGKQAGLAQFIKRRPDAVPLIVGANGIALTTFFNRPASEIFT